MTIIIITLLNATPCAQCSAPLFPDELERGLCDDCAAKAQDECSICGCSGCAGGHTPPLCAGCLGVEN